MWDAGRDRTPPAAARVDGRQYWFCSDRCQHRFTADRHRYVANDSGTREENADDSMIDAVCGMTVDPVTEEQVAVHDGRRYYFYGPGCRTDFLSDAVRYAAGAPAGAAHDDGDRS